MSLRIGFDLDGVLADMESELVRQAEALFGESMTRVLETRAETRSEGDPKTDPPGSTTESAPLDVPQIERLNMTSRQQKRLWTHVESIENFWMTLQEFEPGGIARLYTIASERRWEIIFLTKRPESAGLIAQLQSQRWLESKGYALPSLYVVQKSRGRIADALGLDLVIDDRPENCLDVVSDSKARSILLWRDGDKQVPAAARRLGIGVVGSLKECLEVLTTIDDERASEPGLVDRFKRLFGLGRGAKA